MLARVSKHLARKHNLMKTLLAKQNLSVALSRLFKYSVVTACGGNEQRATAAAAAVKSHAAATVKAIMEQLEVAHVELDEYRRNALIAMTMEAKAAQEGHDRQQQQQQQLFVSSTISSDSWNATADFVRSKLLDAKVSK